MINDNDTEKADIQCLEKEILNITGDPLGPTWSGDDLTREDYYNLRDLLETRAAHLTDIFLLRQDCGDIARLLKVDRNLTILTQIMLDQTDLMSKRFNEGDISGRLLWRCDRTSIAKLQSDGSYGSDFERMLLIIYDAMEIDDTLKILEYSSKEDGNSLLFDEYEIPILAKVSFGTAIHNMLERSLLSLPDVIRITDYYVETHVRNE